MIWNIFIHSIALILIIVPQINNEAVEMFHYSNEGKSSWYEFAKEVISISGINCHFMGKESF